MSHKLPLSSMSPNHVCFIVSNVLIFFLVMLEFYSPVFIDKTANIDITVKRVLWGKFLNAGQTCIAPDYVLCSQEVQTKFVEKAKEVLSEWYGSDPKNATDYCRIVSEKHLQ